jgi:drug/metabolite transporter (DMT)-like permease
LTGELFALAAAAVWSLAVILFKKGGESVPPVSLNLFKTVLALLLFFATVVVLGEPLFPARPARDYVVLFASGIIGITVSDTLLFFSLNLLGAGFMAIVECLYSPFVILASLALLGERPTIGDGVGLALILLAILTVAGRPRSAPVQGVRLLLGILLGALAMATLALAIVLMKPVIETSSPFWANFIRLLAAASTLAVVAVLLPGKQRVWACFRPTRIWRTTVPASILGTYVSLLFWVLGFKYTLASRAAILNQSHTVFVLVLAALLLGEPITRRKVLAIAFGLAGVAVITLV